MSYVVENSPNIVLQNVQGEHCHEPVVVDAVVLQHDQGEHGHEQWRVDFKYVPLMHEPSCKSLEGDK